MHYHLVVLISAFFLEATFGYPEWLYARIRHPVVWIGAGITLLEKNFNHPEWNEDTRRILGVTAIALLLAITIVVAMLIHSYGGLFIEILCTASLLAARSLYVHIREVLTAITGDGPAAGREKVSCVVGRDVAALDESGICRAAIESLAESFSDGVAAPLFWAVCFGLPGIACYKTINTADSMIGHKDELYRAFGWAAARLDDLANFIPARLSGLLIAIASRSTGAVRCMASYAHKHASPNAGWPESAMAGALQVRLGGVNSYDGVEYAVATMGDGTAEIKPIHLQKALHIYLSACSLLCLMLLLALLMT